MNEFLEQSRCAFRCLHGLDVTPETLSPDTDLGFDMARRNRVAGLWANRSNDALIGKEWRRYTYGQILYCTRLADEVGRIVEALSDSVEGLRMVKGPVLAAQAWPRPELRSFDDLDFRCEKHSLDALTVGLQKLGYQPKETELRRRENLWHFGWGISFKHPDGFWVEFNHRMFPPHFPWPERLTRHTPALWVPQELGMCMVDSPLPALHLLLSCVHAVWHGWERLVWRPAPFPESIAAADRREFRLPRNCLRAHPGP